MAGKARDIKKGVEITISYTLGSPSQLHRQHLKENFGFKCTCDLCSLTDEALKIIYDRLVLIRFLDDAIGGSD